MLKLILILIFALPIAMAAQMTWIPDYRFETALINLGLDSPPLNDSVPTKNIDTVTSLDLSWRNIATLKGIEDFIALEKLICLNNQIVVLNLRKNTALKMLACSWNHLMRVDISKNTALNYFNAEYNPDLYCIQVADSALAANNKNWYKGKQAHYSTNCNYTGVENELKFQETVSVIPNPASDFVEVDYGNVILSEAKNPLIIICNLFGEKVISSIATPPDPLSRGGSLRIDISGLAAGVYFVRVGDKVQKFIKY
jgi:Leucine-rich repeat (LRR) protein